MYARCVLCGAFARLNRFGVCMECQTFDEQALQLALEILDGESPVDLFELAEIVSVPSTHIFRWVRQGRIQSSSFHPSEREKDEAILINHSGASIPDQNHAASSHKPHERFYRKGRVEKLTRLYFDRITKLNRVLRRESWIH